MPSFSSRARMKRSIGLRDPGRVADGRAARAVRGRNAQWVGRASRGPRPPGPWPPGRSRPGGVAISASDSGGRFSGIRSPAPSPSDGHDQRALLGLARDDRRPALAPLERRGGRVEPQPRPRLGRAVARDAMRRQERLDVAQVVDRLGGANFRMTWRAGRTCKPSAAEAAISWAGSAVRVGGQGAPGSEGAALEVDTDSIESGPRGQQFSCRWRRGGAGWCRVGSTARLSRLSPLREGAGRPGRRPLAEGSAWSGTRTLVRVLDLAEVLRIGFLLIARAPVAADDVGELARGDVVVGATGVVAVQVVFVQRVGLRVLGQLAGGLVGAEDGKAVEGEADQRGVGWPSSPRAISRRRDTCGSDTG